MKRAFIPKKLRPDIPGQYIDIGHSVSDGQIDCLKNIEVSDINNRLSRRKIIMHLLNEDNKSDDIKIYMDILNEMFQSLNDKSQI